MNLNLGSGQHPTDLPGWVNVDLPWDGVRTGEGALRALGRSPYVFTYADAFHLPFKDDAFDRCYLGHFIEHIWWYQLDSMLAEVQRVVVDSVMVVGPALERAVHDKEPDWLLDAVVGAGEGPGAHKWIPTEELHILALELNGYTATVLDVRDVKPPLWPNPVCRTPRGNAQSPRSRRGNRVKRPSYKAATK